MKKVLILLFSLVHFSSIVAADGNNMMGSGMSGMGGAWLIYVVIAAVIFSVTFWLTYKLVVKNKKSE